MKPLFTLAFAISFKIISIFQKSTPLKPKLAAVAKVLTAQFLCDLTFFFLKAMTSQFAAKLLMAPLF